MILLKEVAYLKLKTAKTPKYQGECEYLVLLVNVSFHLSAVSSNESQHVV